MPNPKVESRLVSSLAKVFPQSDIKSFPAHTAWQALRGERFSYQFVYRFPFGWGGWVNYELESELKDYITVRRVEMEPVRFTAYATDNDVLSMDPGLYPDILYPIDGEFRVAPDQWCSLWISVDIPAKCKPGKYPIKLKLYMPSNPDAKDTQTTKTFTLEVLDATLPKQDLIVTHWFHCDCLANYYQVPVFSEEFWQIVENYFQSYASHGSNMVLTPLFTPPLDTEVGKERLTVQLVQVTKKGKKYSFDFSLLERWIELAQKCGIRYFEMSHLFSQWGAQYAPKIVDVKGNHLFGWDTASDSEEYCGFLRALLPELTAFLDKKKLRKYVYFHCSDEPNKDFMEYYRKASTLLREQLKGFKMCDALSSVEFYKTGLVETPIPSENHIEPFVEAGVKPLWTYYCCGQVVDVSNRFLHFPSSRNRIIGALMYRYDIAGFLQWGFNFWNACLSKGMIDPYADINSYYAFPPGDGFMVYPGKDGKPVESIHHEVFAEGLQDLRLLKLLEKKIGREALEKFLDDATPGRRMTMAKYPRGEAAMLRLRKRMMAMLAD